MLATMYMCLSGTPFIYQGQEIGMTNINLPSIDLYDDVSTKNTYALFRKLGFSDESTIRRAMYASRDNARTPVQWTAGKNAGFTDGDEAWFHINPNYTEVNVEAAEKDPDSLLNYYRKLIKFRKEHDVVKYGQFVEHYHDNDKLFVYSKHFEDQRLLVILSFSENEIAFKAPESFDLEKGELVLGNYNTDRLYGNGCYLKPYECRVYLFK